MRQGVAEGASFRSSRASLGDVTHFLTEATYRRHPRTGDKNPTDIPGVKLNIHSFRKWLPRVDDREDLGHLQVSFISGSRVQELGMTHQARYTLQPILIEELEGNVTKL